MPNDANPQTCISSFSNDYKEATKKEYLKNEKLIYSFLLKTGDEENALKISERTLNVSKESSLKKSHRHIAQAPSYMNWLARLLSTALKSRAFFDLVFS